MVRPGSLSNCRVERCPVNVQQLFVYAARVSRWAWLERRRCGCFLGTSGNARGEYFAKPYDNVTFIDGYPVYQNPSVNEWQADWSDGVSWGTEIPVELDWADNLTRRTWTERSKIRVEIVLSTAVDPALHPLSGYNMYSLGGTKLNEVFVTNTTKYTTTSAMVYSNVARLKIERLNTPGGVPVSTIYNSPCYEGYFVDGPTDAYSTEVNMGGKCIYGYNWDVGAVPLDTKSGWYRLTFSLDGNASYTDAIGNSHTYRVHVKSCVNSFFKQRAFRLDFSLL
jgi:hypothetical protein